jgi:hypothetical protein
LTGWLRRTEAAGAAPPGPTGGRPRFGRLIRLGVACVAATTGLICLLAPPGIMKLFELRLLDYTLFAGLPAAEHHAGGDRRSLGRIGHWPWPRTRTAEMIVKLGEGGAVIALDPAEQADQNSSLTLARELWSLSPAQARARAGPGGEFARGLERRWSPPTTTARSRTLAASRQVVVPYFFVFPRTGPPIDDEAGGS